VFVSAPVGADIESICGKCGDGWHVVVAKVGDRIAKVLCKQCGREHRHRPPGGAPPEPRAVRAKSTSPSPARRTGKPAPEPPPVVTFDPSQPPRSYRPTEAYHVGERIHHATFGVGVVEQVTGPGKMQVFFPDGRRVLAQAKPVATLEPRSARPPVPEEEEG
jgi:hypothetical protein